MNWILILSFAFLLEFASGWQNEYDGRLRMECPVGKHIWRVESVHDNRKEDRKWQFSCRSGYVSSECTWSGYVNDWDKKLSFTCSYGRILTGVSSYHNSKKEDRRWKFKCCKLNTKPGIRCSSTGYINDFDKKMNYRLSAGRAITGFYSYHNNRKEDRKWKIRYCSFALCQVVKMNILDRLKPRRVGERVVGIVTSQGCSPGVSYQTALGSTDSVTETHSFTTGKTTSFTYSREISVAAEMSTKLLGSGGSVTVGVSQSFGGSIEWSSEKTVETSKGMEASSSSSMTYTGPGASLIFADVQQYEFDSSNVNVEYEITCSDGVKLKKRDKVSLTAKTYGQTHFFQKYGTFKPGKCTLKTAHCIRNINGQKALAPEILIGEFRHCFSGGVGSVSK